MFNYKKKRIGIKISGIKLLKESGKVRERERAQLSSRRSKNSVEWYHTDH